MLPATTLANSYGKSISGLKWEDSKVLMVNSLKDGCRFFPTCSQCPFPDCIADNIPSLLTAAKRAEAIELEAQGMPKAQIARRLGVSRMTIYKYLE